MASEKNETPSQPQSNFDPFRSAPNLTPGSKSWLYATLFQGVCTCGFLALLKVAEGRPWERHARLIVLIGIISTWGLVLRTIRERLMELMRHWHKASKGLLQRASASGRHVVPVPLTPTTDRYIKQSIRRLRIIAAGLTIPFFIMPMTWTFIAVMLSYKQDPGTIRDQWAVASLFTLFSAFVVAGYLHWAILPLPIPVRVTASSRRVFPQRSRS